MKNYKANPFGHSVSCLQCGKTTKAITAFCTDCQLTSVRGIKSKIERERITNCLGCGKDTASQSGYCGACLGQGVSNSREKKDRRIFQWGGEPIANLTSIHEDDYSEEAFPD